MLSVKGINSRIRSIMQVDKDVAKDIMYSIAYDTEGVDPKDVLTGSGYLRNTKIIRENPTILETFTNNLKSWSGYKKEFDPDADPDDLLDWLQDNYGIAKSKQDVKDEYYNLLDEIANKYYNGDTDEAKVWVTAHGGRSINADMVDWGSKYAKGQSTSTDLIGSMKGIIGNIRDFRNRKM